MCDILKIKLNKILALFFLNKSTLLMSMVYICQVIILVNTTRCITCINTKTFMLPILGEIQNTKQRKLKLYYGSYFKRHKPLPFSCELWKHA